MALAAFDLGARRIGIAVTDDVEQAVHPLCVIERRSKRADFEAIRRALGTRPIELLIVGLPLNMDGSEGPMARHARNFAAQLSASLGIPVELHDERLSSFEAEQRLAGPLRRGKKKPAIDAVAAAVILEGWLQARRLSPKGARS